MNRGPIQLGTGEAITLHRAAIEVARLAKDLLGKDLSASFDVGKFEGDKGRIADLSRSRTILDWKSKVGIAEGLEATFKWILRDMARSPAAPTPGNTAAAAGSTTWQPLTVGNRILLMTRRTLRALSAFPSHAAALARKLITPVLLRSHLVVNLREGV